MAENGRPPMTDDQFQKLLEDLAPFLKLGQTLSAAVDSANLWQHRTVLYEKLRRNDWFADKVKAYQAYPGQIANDILSSILVSVKEKMKQGLPPSDEDMRNVRFMAEKHRSAQPYFVNRTENAASTMADVGRIIDTIDQGENYDDLAAKAKQQVVANDAPVQNQGQDGKPGDIPAEPSPAPTFGGEGNPPIQPDSQG